MSGVGTRRLQPFLPNVTLYPPENIRHFPGNLKKFSEQLLCRFLCKHCMNYLNLSCIILKKAKHTLKIFRCEQRKIFKVCLAIFQHYLWKGQSERTKILEIFLSSLKATNNLRDSWFSFYYSLSCNIYWPSKISNNDLNCLELSSSNTYDISAPTLLDIFAVGTISDIKLMVWFSLKFSPFTSVMW